MHEVFTDEELKWINTKTFGWEILPGCPDSVGKQIKRKLKTLRENGAWSIERRNN